MGDGSEARPSYLAGEQVDELMKCERDLLGLDSSGVSRPSSGLCLSGGGIRSAAFNTGVLQALVSRDRLRHFDYLSTVSGGGYIGVALTWWLHRGLPTSAPSPAGLSPDNFPFGARPRTTGPSVLNETERAQNGVLDFLRHHASYLNPTPRLNMMSFFAVVLRATSVSIFVYFMQALGVLGLLLSWGMLGGRHNLLRWVPGVLGEILRACGNVLIVVGLGCGGLLFTAALVYSLWSRVRVAPLRYQVRTVIQMWVGQLASFGLFAVFLGLLPWMRNALSQYRPWMSALGLDAPAHDGSLRSVVVAALVTLLGAVLGAQEGRAQLSGSSLGRILSRVRAPLAVLFVSYGLLLGAYSVAYFIYWLVAEQIALASVSFASLLAVGLLFGLLSNINYVGMHRLYRDRLMELWLPNMSAVRHGEWQLASEADRTGIHQVCGLEQGQLKRPYHLINTNVVLVDSAVSRFRGRGGDSFVLSPLYCGSQATGYRRSDEYMNAKGGRGMSLASAMAISGAAVNPHTGVSGRGLTRNRIVSMLLSLLNLRLGYWAPHPGSEKSQIPNFVSPGLTAGFLASGLHERGRIVELTDGGHFENLGVYELLRRRVSYIVVCDAGADPHFEFSDLANLVERARADFGAKIYFPEDTALSKLCPQPGAGMEQRLALAQRGYAVAKIRYQGDSRDAPSGTLIYLKTTMIPGLPADLLGYKLAHADFPDQSTSDQFFDETQFEAYRELGYRIGEQFLESEDAQAVLHAV